MNIKLFEDFNANLNEDFFKTEGLEIAKNECKKLGDYNGYCDKISDKVVKEALKQNISCEVIKPYVIYNNDFNNNHYSILHNNKVIDYTLMQFLGDNKTIDYFELTEVKDKVYCLDTNTMKGASPDFLKDLDFTNLTSIDISKIPENYLIEIIS